MAKKKPVEQPAETAIAVIEKPKEGILFQGASPEMIAEFKTWIGWKVTDVNDKTQLKELSDKARRLQKARTGIDEIRKERNDDYQKIIKENNAKAKALTDEIVSVESHIKAEQKRVEDIQAAERLKKEQEKVDARKLRIQEAGAVMTEGAIKSLSDEAFEEAFTLAVAQAEQQKILDKQRADQEEERQRLERERLERERLEREEAERVRAQQEADRLRLQKQEDDRRAEEARQRAEAQRLEDERLAAERKRLDDQAAELQRQRDEENRKAEERRLEQERLQREAQERIDAENRRLQEERLEFERRKQREADAAYERFEADFATNGESVVSNWTSLYPEISDRIGVHIEAARERAAAEVQRLAEEQAISEAAAVIADDEKLQSELDSVTERFSQSPVFESRDEAAYIPPSDAIVLAPEEPNQYQLDAIEKLIDQYDGSVAIQCPTGAGKGELADALVLDRSKSLPTKSVEIIDRTGSSIDVGYAIAISSAAKAYVELRANCETNGHGEDAVEAAYAKLAWMIDAETHGWDPATYTPE